MKTMVKSFFVFAFLVLPILGHAGADIYYVTQNGTGAKNGTSLANSWSVWQFNSLSGTGYAGCTFYFSGKITSTVYPRISGTSGNYVTLDGYERGDCDPLNVTCDSTALLTGYENLCAMWVDEGDDYLIIQDFRITIGNLSIYTRQGSDVSNYVIVRRNYIYDTNDRMFNAWQGTASTGPTYLTVDGNKMVGFGKTRDCPGGLQFNKTHNAIIKNNILGHEGSTVCTSANTIEVHNSAYMLFEYNELYGAPSGSNLAVKEHGSHDIIVRFNIIRDSTMRGFGVNWPDSYNYYAYGNLIHSNGIDGFSIFDGAHDIHFWSNVIYDSGKQGIYTWYVSGRGHSTHLKNVYLYNNTIYNTTGASDVNSYYNQTGISLNDSSGTNIHVKNNIMMDNRPNATQKHQLYNTSSVNTTTGYNTSYHPDVRATWYVDGSFIAPSSTGTNNTVENPRFTDASNSNFTLAGDSPCIDSGEALSRCFTVDIQDTNYIVCYDDALDPVNTDWTTTPPTVATLKQDNYGSGWERGAYIYTGDQPIKRDLRSPKNLRVGTID